MLRVATELRGEWGHGPNSLMSKRWRSGRGGGKRVGPSGQFQLQADLRVRGFLVEQIGIEPTTSSLQSGLGVLVLIRLGL